MAARFFGVPALRDVSQTEFDAKAEALDPVVFRRARHVIRENIRTLQAAPINRETGKGRKSKSSDTAQR